MQFNINTSTHDFNNPFLKKDITSVFPANSTCTKENRDLCNTKCDEVMREISNNYDLTKVPKNSGIEESLGQYICDKIGKDINYKYVIFASRHYCYKDEHNYSESFNKTNPIFEAICCEKRQFQEKCEYDPNKDEDFQRLMNDTSISTTTKF